MANKWGESFLKSGLPLEHLTLMIFNSFGWDCEPKYEYRRLNREGDSSWFELDLIAYSPYSKKNGNLEFLVECKYHDEQRFWIFHPCTTLDHQAQYGALSAGEDIEADSYVAHYAPYSPLKMPNSRELIKLAPKSTWGSTISKSGQKEQNSVQAALDQISYGFVHFCLDRLYDFCSFEPKAVIPMIVTTAKLFRLYPNIKDITSIRNAKSPTDVSDELSWTWYNYAPRGRLLDHNTEEIEKWKENHFNIKFLPLKSQFPILWSSPHWIMIVNIDCLCTAIESVYKTFSKLPKNFTNNKILCDAIEAKQKYFKLDK